MHKEMAFCETLFYTAFNNDTPFFCDSSSGLLWERNIIAERFRRFEPIRFHRSHRKRMNFEKVISIIQEVSGTQLTPDVVDAFMRLVEKGEFRDPDDVGEGSMENIENVRNK